MILSTNVLIVITDVDTFEVESDGGDDPDSQQQVDRDGEAEQDENCEETDSLGHSGQLHHHGQLDKYSPSVERGVDCLKERLSWPPVRRSCPGLLPRSVQTLSSRSLLNPHPTLPHV